MNSDEIKAWDDYVRKCYDPCDVAAFERNQDKLRKRFEQLEPAD